jgi:hypothetical protein
MKITKRHLRKIVDVTFDDHASGGPIIPCRVWGRMVYLDDKQIIIRSWECDPNDDTDHNHEHFSIVKSAIKVFKVLR